MGLKLYHTVLLSVTAFPCVAQLPPIMFRLEERCENVRAFFDNNVSGTAFHWSFSDGAVSTAPRPVHDLPYGSNIVVTLTATLSDGSTYITALEITTPERPDDVSSLEFPNVFTPNGDGINDVFGPLTDRQLGTCTELRVFNRFGETVFFGNGIMMTWDGRTFAGEPATDGTYFYTFSASGSNFTGHITLIR
jgi:gliding motility-associated-like protein